jgi:hypothetical protein
MKGTTDNRNLSHLGEQRKDTEVGWLKQDVHLVEQHQGEPFAEK